MFSLRKQPLKVPVWRTVGFSPQKQETIKSGGSNFIASKGYIFYKTGTTWKEQAGIPISNFVCHQYVYDVPISGDEIVVALPFKSVFDVIRQGKVYFFCKYV